MNINLSEQETKIYNYLKSRDKQEVPWEELAQFAKDPSSVKKSTIQKTVSEIKRKFKTASLGDPFEIKFTTLVKPPTPVAKAQQVMVEVKRTPAGTIVPVSDTRHAAQIDFYMDPQKFKKVVTKSGKYQLNDPEWDMFKYFYANPGKLITISELRDQVTFYKTPASKLPARWFDSIMRIVNNLRRQVTGLDKRILTVKGTETSYIFQ